MENLKESFINTRSNIKFTELLIDITWIIGKKYFEFIRPQLKHLLL